MLLCLPHAGAGASFFLPWNDLAGPGLSVQPVQLPGREELIDEEPYRDVASAIRGIDAELPPLPERVALFGHSFGAVLAFELARTLEARGDITVEHVFVSGSPGPSATRVPRASGLDDDEFLDRVQEFAGYRHPAFDIPELREVILPTLRADVLAHEEYRPPSPAPIRAPITCLRGSDDHLVSADDAAAWHASTSSGFELVTFPGGHMYLLEQADVVCKTIADRMAAGA
jgi:surfactin synthase thioesterase subunit